MATVTKTIRSKAKILAVTNVTQGRSYTSTPAAATSYQDNGGVQLTDGNIDVTLLGSCCVDVGWDSVNPVIKITQLKYVKINYVRVRSGVYVGIGVGGWSCLVEGSTDNSNWSTLTTLTLSTTTTGSYWVSGSFTPTVVKYIRFTFTRTGQWVMLSELQAYGEYSAWEKTVSAKARIERSLTKTVRAKARIFKAGHGHQIHAKARVVFTKSHTISSKARLEKIITKTIQARSKIEQTFAKNIQAKAHIIGVLLLDDTISPTDAVLLEDIFLLTDRLVHLPVLYSTSDTVVVSDGAVAYVLGKGALLLDTISVTDSSVLFKFGLKPTDQITITDSIEFVKDIHINLDDVIT